MPRDYVERILKARVYDIARETPLDVAPILSARLNAKVGGGKCHPLRVISGGHGNNALVALRRRQPGNFVVSTTNLE